MAFILFEAVDIYWIGRLNVHAVTGVASASFYQWVIFSIMEITLTGVISIVAHLLGAGEVRQRFEVIRESIWISLLICFFLMMGAISLGDRLFVWMGLDELTLPYASDYFKIFVVGLPITYLNVLMMSILNGYGKTSINSMILLLTLVLNMALDPLLIFGYGSIPAMGVSGAACATLFCHFVGTCARYMVLRRFKMIDSLRLLIRPTRWIHFRRIVSIGLPSALTNVTWNIIFPVLALILSDFGMPTVAALNLGQRWEGFPYVIALGMSIAVTTLVGQASGRKDFGAIQRVVNVSLMFISVVFLPISGLFIFFPDFLIGILNPDSEIIHHGATYLRIVGYFELFLGWEILFEGIFNGLGKTRPYMWVRVPLTLARVPLALFLAYPMGLGANGVWWAITLSTLLKGIGVALVYLFQRRHWPLAFRS